MGRRHTYLLGLGSNIEPREAYMLRARNALQRFGKTEKSASLYESSAYGVTDQADFLNSAVRFSCELEPRRLLDTIKQIEKEMGREVRQRWGPREIDIDILAWDGGAVEEEGLHVPHRELAQRRFVLAPLAEIAADWTAGGKTIWELFKHCPDNGTVRIVKKEW